MEEEALDKNAHINHLPNEILEYIISLLLPYQDLEQCQLVCKRWQIVVKSVIKHKKLEFYRAISNFCIQWVDEEESVNPVITKRYFHSACSHENAMYVFGGCACASTTFNDLWKLDLSTRSWSRLLTMGSYPCPKACATLVYYNNTLILYGGWTYPSPYPLHQPWTIFNELHVYDIVANRWSAITSTVTPPSMAGHTATVHGNNMVVFGGLDGHNSVSNDVWCLNLKTMSWCKKDTSDKRPHARYKHSQIAIDEDHLIILGGYIGPPNMMSNDVWLLTMTGKVWVWSSITINNTQWAASHLWCHPACKVDDFVVVLSRNPESSPTPLAYTRWAINSHTRNHQRRPFEEQNLNNGRNGDEVLRGNSNNCARIDRDVNVNGRRGSFISRVWMIDRPANPWNPRRASEPSSGRISTNAIHLNSIRGYMLPNLRNQEKRLDVLRKMEEKIRQIKKDSKRSKHPKMAMFVLNISKILEEKPEADWLPLRRVAEGSPEPTIFYTLVKGNGELIMFGGIKKDASAVQSSQSQQSSDEADIVSNSLHFITAPVTTV
ncbi:F-box only protein 42 [Cimex lectularius]|uniref:F-box domain-containing protein n=1 Tax=Cimex lectularius TaxID=79782 RepID=A0A8I6S264_CIMLE|nr:F-box only protein 42 [Cimex lectularius]